MVPYFMSSHPGCTMKEAVRLAEYIRDLGFTPEQVQDFYPTPATLSTCMYYTGRHPLTGEKVYVPKDPHEKAVQRALLQYRKPENRSLVLEGLKLAGRMDLVGYGPKCLLRPDRPDRADRTGRTDRTGRMDRRDRVDRTDRTEKPDRTDRTDRTDKGGGRGEKQKGKGLPEKSGKNDARRKPFRQR